MQDENSLPDQFLLREDLIWIPRDDGSGRVVVEDRVSGKFFRIGQAEFQFVEALLETGSAESAWRQCQQADAGSCLNRQKCESFCKWLLASGLTRLPRPASTGIPSSESWRISKILASAFFWRVPLVNPDRHLQRFNLAFGWMFGANAIWTAILVLLGALIITTGKWNELLSGYEGLFSSWRWVVLTVAWCALKIVHEVAHGATCRRYGGEVKEAGLAMILFVPIAYVNVTSSWRFTSRWKRLHVTLAGVGVELFIAGWALIVWNWTDVLSIQQAAADVFLLASISSLVLNLNPLLKFD
ncbi:MAG: hypothetical protein AAF989_14285, partial [Planctomycetota bacterium]